MVAIHLETYTTDSISAHKEIRQKDFGEIEFWILQPAFEKHVIHFFFFLCPNCRKTLKSELAACQAEKQVLESTLSSFEILGKEFEALAAEYGKLREKIEIKKWAQKEFTKYNA